LELLADLPPCRDAEITTKNRNNFFYGAMGKARAAAAEEDALRSEDLDDSDQIFTAPLLAYLSPGRFAEIRQTRAFPFPKGFSR
jgi:hypothetical protein